MTFQDKSQYPKVEFDVDLGGGIKVKAFKQGNPEGVPCLFVGPGSIYLPMIPDSLKEKVCFYGVDYYWTTGAGVPPEVIKSLTIDQMIADFELFRARLGLERVLAFGPSAVGLIAIEWSRLHPNHALGVIGMNTPLTVANLGKRELFYVVSNLHPYVWNDNPMAPLPSAALSTCQGRFFEQDWRDLDKNVEDRLTYYKTNVLFHPNPEFHTERWAKFCGDVQTNEEFAKQELTNVNGYLAALHRDAMLYLRDDSPEAIARWYDLWKDFNILTRAQFFQEVFKYDFSHIGATTVPVFVSLGLYDGMAPFTTVTDSDVENLRPKNFTYHIFDSGHVPSLEVPNAFAEQVSQWMQRMRINPLLTASDGQPSIVEQQLAVVGSTTPMINT